MSNPYLSVGEVAQLLGVSVKFVYKHGRELPGYLKIAGLIRFDRDVLQSRLKELASQPSKRDRAVSYSSRHGL
jgi:hypothetical protein